MDDHVFICYTREDQEFVLHLAMRLKERGVPVWLDRWNIRAGANWNKSIDEAIGNCDKFLVVLSPAAVDSEDVQGEWLTALDEHKRIVPVLCQACRIPRRLRVFQYVDFTARGPEDEAALEHVISVLGGTPEAAPLKAAQRQAAASPPAERTHAAPPEAVPRPSRPLHALQPAIHNSIGMELVLIPVGEFLMGSTDGYEAERPVHRVQISQPFYLGKYPVTQAQWEAVMGTNPSKFKGDPNRPVESVSWEDAQEFLRKLSAREGGTPYRLPAEAEWEYAARAGATTAYSFGDDPALLREYAWYAGNSERSTQPVGQLKPNAWGLYDMQGNVGEWVEDWYVADYYQQSPERDPQGPNRGKSRVVRGGSWNLGPRGVRVSDRGGGGPGGRVVRLGFRCAR